jgi:PAS domain S-box-containing protein
MDNHGPDASMTGMLEEGMLENFSGLPMPDVGNPQDENHSQETFSAMNSSLQNQNSPMDNGSPHDQRATESPMSGAGAGPLPTGFGAQSIIGGGSTLAEFTKRRNWAQRIVDELKDFLHILTPDGRIVYISPCAKDLTGYSNEELQGKFIVDFIHPDDSGIFVREFNESIASGHPLRFFYRFRKQNGEYTIFESHGHPHLSSEANFGSNSSACRGFFMMARPYPTKNAALLDSFLEHKIENERLKKRIAALRQEEIDEAEEAEKHWAKRQQESSSEIQASEENDTLLSQIPGTLPIPSIPPNSDMLAMPPPSKPPAVTSTLTRHAIEEVNASSKPDSITDKMARYEGATHIETIEMLTGLRYQDGERSQGISTGDASPALIRGDVGIAIPADKDPRTGDKKKKVKVADEYVCTDCGNSIPP